MKPSVFILLVLHAFVQGLYAQTATETETKLKALMDKKAEYHHRTDGEYDGYRIKIHFGTDKTKAREIKAKFLSKHPEYTAYDEYQQPNFVVVVGDFRSKPEAFDLYKKIQGEFPNAFIVKDKIRPVKL